MAMPSWNNRLNEDQVEMIFNLHWGCEYSFDGEHGVYILGACPKTAQAVAQRFKGCKLHLTRPSDISKEDALALGKLAGMSRGFISHRDDNFLILNKGSRTIEILFPVFEFRFKRKGVLQDRVFELPRQFLIKRGYEVPLFFGEDHPLNDETAIDLGIAHEKSFYPYLMDLQNRTIQNEKP